MDFLKKFFTAFFMMFVFGLMTASAKEAAVEIPKMPQMVYELAEADNLDAARSELIEGIKAFKESINLSRYNLTLEEYQLIASNIVYDNPELFYVSARSFPCSYIPSTKMVVEAKPVYLFEKEQAKAKKAFFEDEIQKAASCAKDEMSDAEKVLSVHDYFCTEFSYDTTYEKYTPLELFETKSGVCQAYSIAFKAVMDKLKIECDYAVSENMNHMWNIVKIDGKWYHVDVTWDDPLPDSAGRAMHNNFLVTDEGITAAGHYDFQMKYTVSDTEFENAFWSEAKSKIPYYNGKWLFINQTEKTIEAYTYSSGVRESVYSFTDRWSVADKPGYFWSGVFSGLDVYGGEIYFNTPDKICKIDLNSNVQTVYSYESGEKSIYGFKIACQKDGDYVFFELRRGANDEESEIKKTAIAKMSAKAAKSGDKYNITACFSSLAENKTAVFAVYNAKGKLIEVKTAKVENGSTSASVLQSGAESIYVMCFGDLENIMPAVDMCRAVIE